jgi:3-hydroxy-9,10-secoandrosta-1,3,5(10)-triene-9,17-dione monooxygenase
VWDASPDALITTGYRTAATLAAGRLTGRWESVVGAEQAEWLQLPADHRTACRVLVPRSGVCTEPVNRPTGLRAAGVCHVTASAVADRHVFTNARNPAAVIAGAGVAAAVVGSANGVWRRHVDQVRVRLTTSHGGGEVSHETAAQVARAASDIDRGFSSPPPATATGHRPPATGHRPRHRAWGYRQAIARARGAADRLLGSSRHALDASDSVTRLWRDVHAGCRLTVQVLDRLESTAPAHVDERSTVENSRPQRHSS